MSDRGEEEAMTTREELEEALDDELGDQDFGLEEELNTTINFLCRKNDGLTAALERQEQQINELKRAVTRLQQDAHARTRYLTGGRS
jgi:prefoldin subunit 5